MKMKTAAIAIFTRKRLSEFGCASPDPKSLFENAVCRVRTAHQPLKAPEGIKRVDNECDRDPTGIQRAFTHT